MRQTAATLYTLNISPHAPSLAARDRNRDGSLLLRLADDFGAAWAACDAQ